MDKIRRLERKLFPCKEINVRDYNSYPLAIDEEFEFMSDMMRDYPEKATMFLFYRYVDKAEADKYKDNPEEFNKHLNIDNSYVEIYVFDKMISDTGYKRFIIRNGYRMYEYDEDWLIRCAKLEPEMTNEYYTDNLYFINEHYPDWCFLNEKTMNRKKTDVMLLHLYFASHRSGPREILYKANLPVIAGMLEQVYDYDFFGTTPSEIIGEGLPIRLLRILNCPYLTKQLFDKEDKMLAKKVYKEYGGYITNIFPTKAQWMYLEELYHGHGIFGDEPFLRALYNNLDGFESSRRLEYYRDYLILRKRYKDLLTLDIPKCEVIVAAYYKLKGLKDSEDRLVYDSYIMDVKKEKDLEYKGEEYSVFMPERVFDFHLEGLRQNNCVVDYMKSHIRGASTILFVRKNDKPNESFVTMEIRDNKVRQLFAKNNQRPPEDVYAFVKKYARIKHITYRRADIILAVPPGVMDIAV